MAKSGSRFLPLGDQADRGSENSASVFRYTPFVAYPSDCYLGKWCLNLGEVKWKSVA
jgi:hypothetical protein